MNQNKEVKEQPQWVVDILNRIDTLEYLVKELEQGIDILERDVEYSRNQVNE